jgi:hypothetical protein
MGKQKFQVVASSLDRSVTDEDFHRQFWVKFDVKRKRQNQVMTLPLV